MLILRDLRLLIIILCTLTESILSAPHLSLTSSHHDIARRISPLVILHPLNVTHQEEDLGIKFHVPHTSIYLYFDLGFRCEEEGIRSTIISARSYCAQHLAQKGDVPLPSSEDPFHEDLGYGAAINVVSVKPDHPLTWGILKNTMDGLWEFLIVEGRFSESTFDIVHKDWGIIVGRGTIIEVPETGLARESRKRQASNLLESVFD